MLSGGFLDWWGTLRLILLIALVERTTKFLDHPSQLLWIGLFGGFLGDLTPISFTGFRCLLRHSFLHGESLLSFECPQIIQGVFDLLSFRMMITVALNLFEPQPDFLFRRTNAFGQLPRIEFKHCGFVDVEP